MNTPTNKKNVEPRLKNWLLQGKSITHNQAQMMFGTNRLAEFIRRLRNAGMNIETKMVSENGDQYGVYKLIQPKKVSRIETQSYRA